MTRTPALQLFPFPPFSHLLGKHYNGQKVKERVCKQAIGLLDFLAVHFLFLLSFTCPTLIHKHFPINLVYNPKDLGVGMLGKVEEVPANMTLACVRASRAVKTCSVFVGGG